MNEEVKEIITALAIATIENNEGVEFPPDVCEKLYDYITNLQEENKHLNTKLNSYKDEFCKDTIKKYELVMEKEYYKLRCKKAIEYIKTRVDSSKASKYELLNILNGD